MDHTPVDRLEYHHEAAVWAHAVSGRARTSRTSQEGESRMSTVYRYALPVELTEWKFEGQVETRFTWEYDEERDGLLALYDKGKKQQWDAATRIDWSQDLDPENPMQLDDRVK